MAQPLAWGIYCPAQAVLDQHWSSGHSLDAHIRKVRLAMVRLANEKGYTLAELFAGYDMPSRLAAVQQLEAHLNAFADVTEAIFSYGAMDEGFLNVLATERIKLQNGLGDYARFFLYRLEGDRPSRTSAVEVVGTRT